MRRPLIPIPKALALALWWCIVLLTALPSWSQSGGKVCVDPEKPDKCWPTIQEGIDAALPGQTVTVVKGSFEENIIIDKAGLILKGKGASKTIVRGIPGDAPLLQRFRPTVSIEAEGITLSDMTVRGETFTAGIVVVADAEGARIEGVSVEGILKVSGGGGDCIRVAARDTRIKKSTIEGCEADGIVVGPEGSCRGNALKGIEILKNTIASCGDECLDLCVEEPLIEDNVITRSLAGDCMDVIIERATNPRDKASISGNEVSACADAGIRLTALDPPGSFLIDGNDVSATGGDGIGVICAGVGCRKSEIVKNNVENVLGAGIRIEGDTDEEFLIEKNFVSVTSLNGIDLNGSGFEVSKNSVSDAGGGAVEDSTFVLAGNCFDVARRPVDPEDPNDPEDRGGNDNILENNTGDHCSQYGFFVVGNRNTLSGNQANDNVITGFNVSNGDENVLEKNTAKKNGVHGFRISDFFFEPDGEGGLRPVGARSTVLSGNKGKKNERADLCDAGQLTSLGADNKFETVDEERLADGDCLSY